MTDLEAMNLPAIKAWMLSFERPPGFLDVVSDWLGFEALMVAVDLLQPRFVTIRGCVLLPWAYQESTFEEWWESLGGETHAIETTLNHLHLWDLFTQPPATDDGLRRLGIAMSRSWTHQLQQQFPDRRLAATYSEDEREYGPTVSVHHQE